jgi:hypothetical protein
MGNLCPNPTEPVPLAYAGGVAAQVDRIVASAAMNIVLAYVLMSVLALTALHVVLAQQILASPARLTTAFLLRLSLPGLTLAAGIVLVLGVCGVTRWVLAAGILLVIAWVIDAWMSLQIIGALSPDTQMRAVPVAVTAIALWQIQRILAPAGASAATLTAVAWWGGLAFTCTYALVFGRFIVRLLLTDAPVAAAAGGLTMTLLTVLVCLMARRGERAHVRMVLVLAIAGTLTLVDRSALIFDGRLGLSQAGWIIWTAAPFVLMIGMNLVVRRAAPLARSAGS